MHKLSVFYFIAALTFFNIQSCDGQAKNADFEKIEKLTRRINNKKAIDIDYFQRGLLYYSQKKFNLALLDFRYFYKKHKNSHFILPALAEVYLDLKQPQKACYYINKAFKFDVKSYNFHLIRGNCLYEIRKYKQAIQDFNFALKKTGPIYRSRNIDGDNSRYFRAKRGRAISALMISNYKLAFIDSKEALKYYKNNKSLILVLGDALYGLKFYHKAIKQYDLLSKICSKCEVAYSGMAFAYAKLGNKQKSANNFIKALKLGYSDVKEDLEIKPAFVKMHGKDQIMKWIKQYQKRQN